MVLAGVRQWFYDKMMVLSSAGICDERMPLLPFEEQNVLIMFERT
jgi:hypothetical protein